MRLRETARAVGGFEREMRLALGRSERPDQVVEDLHLGVLRREQALDDRPEVGGHGGCIGAIRPRLSRAAICLLSARSAACITVSACGDTANHEEGNAPKRSGAAAAPHRAGGRPDWVLDERTRAVGRQGVAQAREILRRLAPPDGIRKAS